MRIAWAGLVVAMVVLMSALKLPRLREVAGAVAGLVAFAAIYPGPWFATSDDPAVLNVMTVGYAVSAALLAFAAGAAYRSRENAFSQILQGLTLFVLTLGCGAVIRHSFLENDWQEDFTLIETGTHALAWLLLGMGSLALGARLKQATLAVGGSVIALLGLTVALLVNGISLNPLGRGEPMGATIIANWLLYVYLLPAALALGLAKLADRDQPPALKPAAAVGGIACLLLLFAWVSLCVRQGFVGSVLDLDTANVGKGEMYAYSMAWVGLGLVLLVVGIATRSVTARWGSLALMMLSVVKVFIFDAANLQDLWRVLSFFGLGVSLIGLGYAYQRWVFGKRVSTSQPEAGS
jgi:uncharacterized membrane protein